MELEGKVALVTGAGRRLGREIALALGQAGADVVAHFGSARDGAETTADSVRRMGRRAWALGADLADATALDDLFATVAEETGQLDVLVNSAAVFERRPFAEVGLADWERTLAVNLRAPFFCMQQAARLMCDGDATGGVIINLADLSGVSPWLGYAVHGASKAGLIFLTEAAARELGPEVRVNAVVPGAILPPPGVGGVDDAWGRRGDALPLGRTGETEHVTGAVLFLIDNDFVTGAVLPVDGGERLVGLAGR